jgi:hypothetical protein
MAAPYLFKSIGHGPQTSAISHIKYPKNTIFLSTTSIRMNAEWFAFQNTERRNGPFGVVFKVRIRQGEGFDLRGQGSFISTNGEYSLEYNREEEIAVPLFIEPSAIEGFYTEDKKFHPSPHFKEEQPMVTTARM